MLKNSFVWFPIFLFFTIGSVLGIDKFLPVFFLLLPIVIEALQFSLNVFFANPLWRAGLPPLLKRVVFRAKKIEVESPVINEMEEKASRKLKLCLNILGVIALGFSMKMLGEFLFFEKVEVIDTFGQKLFYFFAYIVVGYIAKYGRKDLDSNRFPGAEIQQSWFKALFALSWFYGLVLFMGLLTHKIPENQARFIFYFIDMGRFIVYLICFALSAEAILRMIRRFFGLIENAEPQNQIQNFYVIEVFYAKDTVKESLCLLLKKLFGLDLEKSEILRFFVSIFEPILILSIFLIWIASSLVIVPPAGVGVFYNYEGIVSETASLPGLYFKIPWPIGRCEIFEKNKIRVVNIGFEPSENARHLIWTKSHASKNFNLLAGDGLELISIDCQVMFQVKNVHHYLTKVKNPEELLQALAYRFLTLETVSSTFDEVMVKDRKDLSERLKKKIQVELDSRGVGIAITEVVFLAMHPPIEVASSYEDVISAQIDRLTYVQDANSEAIHIKLMNVAFARGEVLGAEGYLATRFAEATGDAQAFVSKSLGYNFSPKLAKFRLKMELLQKFMDKKKLYVIDKTLLRSSDKLYLRLSE